jgi:hypothetical protein
MEVQIGLAIDCINLSIGAVRVDVLVHLQLLMQQDTDRNKFSS